MSLQISPWSTHQKHFRIDSKNKLPRLSPLRRSRNKKQNLSLPLIQRRGHKRQLNIQESLSSQISERQLNQQQEVHNSEEQTPISPDLRRGKQRIYQEIQQTLVLKFIAEQIKRQQTISFLLPSINERRNDNTQSKMKKISIDTDRRRKEHLITPILSQRKKNHKIQEDNQSRVSVVNYNPFDDKKIIQKGLSLLKSRGYKLRRNLDSVSLRIKGL